MLSTTITLDARIKERIMNIGQPQRSMNMQKLNGKRVLVTGGSQGLGLAMVEALVARGANVSAISRERSNLKAAEKVGASVIAGDATDSTLMNSVVRDQRPDVLILNAGTRLPIKPIDQQNWDEFSIVWNTDVKAGLVGIQAALNTPMKRGGRILVMSSGASMVLAVPFIKPEDLSLSGGYVGAKRMLWFMAHCANTVSRERGLELHFQVLAPMQLIPGTRLGHEVAAACATKEGISLDEHVMKRYGSVLCPAQVGEQVAELLGDSRYLRGVAYGFRSGSEIVHLDVTYDRASTAIPEEVIVQ
jgi:NAD(P)-dependent dehydrogenase (short-subunit alcohol dehydrogenase family)